MSQKRNEPGWRSSALRIVSSEPGVETQFQIHLPTNNDSQPTESPLITHAPRIEGRIVVVDDEVSVADFVAEVLRDRGYPKA